MFGPSTRFPRGGHTASIGLSTSRSDAGFSPIAWDLLHGAPALTATGLSPASLIQHDSPCFRTVHLSERNMPQFYRTRTAQTKLAGLSRRNASWARFSRRVQPLVGQTGPWKRFEPRARCQVDDANPTLACGLEKMGPTIDDLLIVTRTIRESTGVIASPLGMATLPRDHVQADVSDLSELTWRNRFACLARCSL
jgi:hypothetical protein